MQNEHLHEIEKELRLALVNDKISGIKDLKKYIGTQYDFMGLSVPTQRKVFKQGFTFNSNPTEKQFKIWEQIWQHSNLYDAMTLALFFCEKHIGEIDTEKAWSKLKKWTPQIDNWAHSDALSGFYSHLLEKEPELIYPHLVKWNTSKNPWERRQSLVSLFEYTKKRSKFLPAEKVLPLVENLLEDEHYFVQKGLGWTLREAGNAYPKETWRFLLKNTNKLSSAAFSSAAEKLSMEQKEQLKLLRKNTK